MVLDLSQQDHSGQRRGDHDLPESVKGLWLNPFFRIAEARGWLKSSWYWTGIDAGFELWKGGRGLRVTDFQVNS
jgi:hypothetical protein